MEARASGQVFSTAALLSPAGLLGQLAEVADVVRTTLVHVPQGGRAARSTTCSALLQDAAAQHIWAPGAVGDFVLQSSDEHLPTSVGASQGHHRGPVGAAYTCPRAPHSMEPTTIDVLGLPCTVCTLPPPPLARVPPPARRAPRLGSLHVPVHLRAWTTLVYVAVRVPCVPLAYAAGGRGQAAGIAQHELWSSS